MLAADPKGLELNHCRRVTIQGLKIDFDPPVFLQAKILEIDEDKPDYVVEIDPEFPDAEMNGGSSLLYRADGRWIAHGYLFYRDIRDLLLPQHATAISVTMVPTHGGSLRKARPLRNIVITGNYIERPGGFGIILTNTDGATVTDNTMLGPRYRPAMVGGGLRTIQFHIGHPNHFEGKARKAAIGLWSCSHIEVRADRLIDPEGFCEHGPVQIGDHCEAIRVVNPE